MNYELSREMIQTQLSPPLGLLLKEGIGGRGGHPNPPISLEGVGGKNILSLVLPSPLPPYHPTHNNTPTFPFSVYVKQ